LVSCLHDKMLACALLELQLLLCSLAVALALFACSLLGYFVVLILLMSSDTSDCFVLDVAFGRFFPVLG